MSRQKEVIFEIVASTMTHPTADWIYQQARQKLPHISLGTVYRNLKALSDEGRLLEIVTTKGPSRYDANTSKHSHLRCVQCGRLEDLLDRELKLSLKKKQIHKFQILEYRIEILGLCPGCKQTSAIKQGIQGGNIWP